MATKSTEQPSPYRNLEKRTVQDLLTLMNDEDQTVPKVVREVLSDIEAFVQKAEEQMKKGGRLFYLGSGTSGRLGILDASECPPTFGVPHDWIIALIAGGDQAIRYAQEFAEDDLEQAWQDLQPYAINVNDIVLGLTASGSTPYVLGGIQACRERHIPCGCLTCNTETPLAALADYPIEMVVGPEVVTGSTRMKAGTAQKLALNMISTALMIRLGRVEDNRMVDMQLSNQKLIERGTKMVQYLCHVSYDRAKQLLTEEGSVRAVLERYG
jgi:N-acetylmuramic acid 6-phosphate etherase